MSTATADVLVINTLDTTVLVEKDLATEELTDFAKKAGYIIDVNTRLLVNGMIHAKLTVWRKSTMGLFAADEMMGWCPTNGCLGLFDIKPPDLTEDEVDIIKKADSAGSELPAHIMEKLTSFLNGTAFCEHCKAPVKRMDFAKTTEYFVPAARLADVVDRLFVNLQANADIFLRAFKADKLVRYKQGIENKERVASVEKTIDTMRNSQTRAIYYRDALLKDISAGKTVSASVNSFLRG